MKHSESSAPGASLPVELVDEIFDIFAWHHATTAKHALATAALTSKTIHHRIRPVLYHTVTITVANFRALARTCRERLERNPFSLTRQLIIQTNALYVIESRAGIFDKFTGITSICAVPYEVELWLMTEPAHKLTVAALFVAQGTGFFGNGLPWRWNPTNLTHLALYVEPVPRLDPPLELRDIYPKLTHVMLDLTRPHMTIRWHLEIAERYLLLPKMRRVLLVISTATPVDRTRVDMPALQLLDLVPHRLVDNGCVMSTLRLPRTLSILPGRSTCRSGSEVARCRSDSSPPLPDPLSALVVRVPARRSRFDERCPSLHSASGEGR